MRLGQSVLLDSIEHGGVRGRSNFFNHVLAVSLLNQQVRKTLLIPVRWRGLGRHKLGHGHDERLFWGVGHRPNTGHRVFLIHLLQSFHFLEFLDAQGLHPAGLVLPFQFLILAQEVLLEDSVAFRVLLLIQEQNEQLPHL